MLWPHFCGALMSICLHEGDLIFNNFSLFVLLHNQTGNSLYPQNDLHVNVVAYPAVLAVHVKTFSA